MTNFAGYGIGELEKTEGKGTHEGGMAAFEALPWPGFHGHRQVTIKPSS